MNKRLNEYSLCNTMYNIKELKAVLLIYMLFTLSIVITTLVLWYDNFKMYKQINLIETCVSYNNNNNKALIANVNINSLVKKPIFATWSKQKWLSLESDHYKRIKIVSKNAFYPFKNKTSIIDEYDYGSIHASLLAPVKGININPLISELTEKYKIYENPIIIYNTINNSICEDVLIDGTTVTSKSIGNVYYNSGIRHDIPLRCTIIGKINNDIIDPSNTIIEKQDVVDISAIKNKYLTRIETNNKWILLILISTLIFGTIRYVNHKN